MGIVILNLKTYKECFQASSLDLLSAVQSAPTEHQLVLCPSALNAALVASHRKGGKPLLFAQHADANGFGAHTGSISLAALRELGFEGTLLNHSEKRISHDRIEKTVGMARVLGMKAVVCAESIDEAKKVAAFSPWAVAIEPPELIGSGVSVSSAQPDLVVRGVQAIKAVDDKVKAFVGAGVSTRQDFQKSLLMGAEGVLLASAFAKAKEPEKWLKDFLA